MKCSKCGLENRPDARFCKQCGQPLQEQAAPPVPLIMPSGTICPACGATAKPEARFCPRCGKPLPVASASPAPSPAADTLPSISPISRPYATPPSPPPPAQPLPYAQPPSQPPPPSAPSAPSSRLPRWGWWVGGIAMFLCIVVLVLAAMLLRPKISGSGEGPVVTPTLIESPVAL